MTTEIHGDHPSNPPLGLGLSEGLGLVPERALWEAMGCVADDEACLRMLSAHIAERVAAERERCARLCEAMVYDGYAPPEHGSAADYYRDGALDCAAEIRKA